jgi:hypothetical protein
MFQGSIFFLHSYVINFGNIPYCFCLFFFILKKTLIYIINKVLLRNDGCLNFVLNNTARVVFRTRVLFKDNQICNVNKNTRRT